MKYSIVIVTYERLELLQKCISEIRSQSPNTPIYVGINGSDSKSAQYLQNIPQVTCKSFNKRTPGEVRNALIQLVETPWICFLDDDVIVSESYFQKAESILEMKSLEIFGGPDTSYPNEESTETAISLALTSPLATAHSKKRHTVSNDFNPNAKEQDFILCNLWMKTSIFHKENNSFDERFFRNEENVLLNKLLSSGKTAHYYGDLFVHHKRKSNLISMSLTVMKSANFRAKSFLLFPESFQPIYLVPSLSFLFLIYSAFYPNLIALLAISTYISCLLYFSWKICKDSSRMNLFFQVVLVQIIINLSYGIGFISPPKSTK
ncbi:putative glycosyl transferase [Halobacteriovorax marinus SJ]|uniref:Glycosyl transferase n=1 Tax=Halobacteriovorax marinus (strain ATCC BAA-682 / DSM 15412 / SJ) TaxID=862908 RepID=E1X0G3_HALMS|nr:glycosyltransferase [Halobacteriovorax marinus]CBW27989.1 putative glycosyl transferase [Halobacteriovorax marinus SJ]